MIEFLKTVDLTEANGGKAAPATSRYALKPDYQFTRAEFRVGDLQIADLDADGRPDLLGVPWMFKQQSDGTLAEPTSLPVDLLSNFAVAYVNGDGLLDDDVVRVKAFYREQHMNYPVSARRRRTR